MNLVPPMPKQLQGQGFYSLTDPKTWKVLVKDNDKEIGILDPVEAQELYPDAFIQKPVEILQLKKDFILDGTPPKEALTEEERLMVLKQIAKV
jgi:hypothetical protein